MSETTEIAKQDWNLVIRPKRGLFDLQLGEVWRYRDLILLLVRRDFVSVYKQTVLGPAWFFIQPLLSTIVFYFTFGVAAGMDTGPLPPLLFFMSGQVGWGYFADCMNKTSATFTANAGIFGKVYFPRLVTPISIVMSSVIKFGVQLLVFLGFWTYFYSTTDTMRPNMMLLFFPVLVLMMAGMGLGFGIIISSLTTKYRDFQFLIQFGLRLLMFISPVVLYLPGIKERSELMYNVIRLNPMTSVIETLRYGFCGGEWTVGWMDVGYSATLTVVSIIVGVILFTKVEKNFMDTV